MGVAGGTNRRISWPSDAHLGGEETAAGEEAGEQEKVAAGEERTENEDQSTLAAGTLPRKRKNTLRAARSALLITSRQYDYTCMYEHFAPPEVYVVYMYTSCTPVYNLAPVSVLATYDRVGTLAR